MGFAIPRGNPGSESISLGPCACDGTARKDESVEAESAANENIPETGVIKFDQAGEQ